MEGRSLSKVDVSVDVELIPFCSWEWVDLYISVLTCFVVVITFLKGGTRDFVNNRTFVETVLLSFWWYLAVLRIHDTQTRLNCEIVYSLAVTGYFLFPLYWIAWKRLLKV